MGEPQGPAKQLQFAVDGRVRLAVPPSGGDIGLDRPEVDAHGAPVPEVVSQGLQVGQDGAEGLLEPLPVGGELIELLAVNPLGELQVRGSSGDLVLLASTSESGGYVTGTEATSGVTAAGGR